jgi:sugar phosphate isomerase/epimerase
MKIGAQLYTVRAFTQTEEALDAALGKVAAAGYTCAQLSGAGPIPAAKARALFDRHGISIIATHTNPDRILNETAAVIEEHKIYGAQYVGIGSKPPQFPNTPEGYALFARQYKPAAQQLRQAGLWLTYHNHAFEFERAQGRHCMEALLDCFAPEELQLLPDVYWLHFAGCDPAQWLRDHGGRYQLLHFKDMIFKDGAQRMAEVLEGNLNWPAIFEAAQAGGALYAFVEQDDCYGEDPFRCLATSLANLRRACPNLTWEGRP